MNEPLVVENVGVQYRAFQSKRPSLRQRLLAALPGRSRHFWALRNVSFKVEQGETFFIIGRNGAGKTTLLRVLAQVLFPTTGSVRIAGRVNAFLSMGLGFRTELTGDDNVSLSLTLMGFARSDIQALRPRITDFASLGDFINAPVRCYSAGMKARLAFSIATSVEPDILLMDEVMSTGDEQFREKCQARVRELLRKARAVVVATHRMSEVEAMGSRVLWIERGEVQRIGAPAAVVASYREFVAAVRRDPFYDTHRVSPSR